MYYIITVINTSVFNSVNAFMSGVQIDEPFGNPRNQFYLYVCSRLGGED